MRRLRRRTRTGQLRDRHRGQARLAAPGKRGASPAGPKRWPPIRRLDPPAASGGQLHSKVAIPKRGRARTGARTSGRWQPKRACKAGSTRICTIARMRVNCRMPPPHNNYSVSKWGVVRPSSMGGRGFGTRENPTRSTSYPRRCSLILRPNLAMWSRSIRPRRDTPTATERHETQYRIRVPDVR